MPGRRIVTMCIFMMLDRDRSLQIDDRQQHEDKCLQSSGDQSEEHHRQRNEKWNERKENKYDHLLAKNIAEEAKRQRHDARCVADDFDWEIQETDDPGSSRRRPEMLDVADDALLFDPMKV